MTKLEFYLLQLIIVDNIQYS